MHEDGQSEKRQLLRDGIGIGVATGAYGISFGAIGVSAGLSPLQASALSMLMFTGASQFALVGVLVSGGGAVAAVVTPVLLGIRNAFYSLRLATLFPGRIARKAVVAHLVIDESAAMSLRGSSPPLARVGFWSSGIAIFILWNLGTLLGAFGGDFLDDPDAWGLDVAAPAAFVALLAPQLRKREAKIVAFLAVIVALVSAPFAPPGVPVLLAAVVAVVFGVGPQKEVG